MRLAALAAAALAAASPVASAAPRDGRPNVILVSIDDLRADRLGCYGGRDVKTPHLDELAAQAVLYGRHFSASGWTLPSHMSLLTSLLPSEHRVYAIEGPAAFPSRLSLRPEVRTLAETLRAAGYATAGFASAHNLRGDAGFSRGFDVYKVRHHADAGDRVKTALDWVNALGGRRFFLFLHLYDLHDQTDWEAAPGTAFYSCAEPGGAPEPIPVSSGVVAGADPRLFSAPQLRTLEGQYDRCVRRVDDALGRLVAGLRRQGLFDSSVVVVTSDHGEAFGEDGLFEHPPALHPVLLRVPLLVKAPGQRTGARVADLTSALDVMPTILALAGVPVPDALRKQMRGRALLPAAPPAARAVFAEETRRASRAVIVDGAGELVEDLSAGTGTLYEFPAVPPAAPPARVYELGAPPAAARPLEEALRERYWDYPGQ